MPSVLNFDLYLLGNLSPLMMAEKVLISLNDMIILLVIVLLFSRMLITLQACSTIQFFVCELLMFTYEAPRPLMTFW